MILIRILNGVNWTFENSLWMTKVNWAFENMIFMAIMGEKTSHLFSHSQNSTKILPRMR